MDATRPTIAFVTTPMPSVCLGRIAVNAKSLSGRVARPLLLLIVNLENVSKASVNVILMTTRAVLRGRRVLEVEAIHPGQALSPAR